MLDHSAKQMPEQSDLEKIAAILLRHDVEFLVIGGQAEVLMGSPRVTYDTDLCYRRTKENLERLAQALRSSRCTAGPTRSAGCRRASPW
jgi:hypothetical protein